MPAKITVDLKKCRGYGNCIEFAPDYFDLDDGGRVIMLQELASDADLERVARAARSCPVKAIQIEDGTQ